MKLNNRKDLIIALIKDDLINTKLVDSLNALGMQADHYRLNASITVMKLMCIKATPQHWEQIFHEYIDRTRKVLQMDTDEFPQLVNALAVEIYEFLKMKRKRETAVIAKI